MAGAGGSTNLAHVRASQIAMQPAATTAMAVVASSRLTRYRPPIATRVAMTPVT